MRFLATYDFSRPGITITHARFTPLFARRPVTQAFIVPYNPAVDLAALAADHATLFSFANANAIDPGQTSGGGEYDVFIFSMDRASDTSTLVGRISQRKSVGDGFEGATTLLDYNGWKVAVISGMFDPSGADSLYAKAVHTPGEEMLALFRTDRLVGL